MDNSISENISILKELENCSICPRNCRVNRFNDNNAYCKSGIKFGIASVCKHYGEEPIVSGKNGICNVFFTKCNLQCIYCQNYQISRNSCDFFEKKYSLEEVLNLIIPFLDSECHALGFVSPSHYALHVKVIVNALNQRGYKPVIVYNTNSFDKVETLQLLENVVDVYLADFKYSDATLAEKLSDAHAYPYIALKAIKEMYRQKGNVLHLNDNGEILSGLIIRHLVLPGFIDNSKNILKIISEEISTNITISLMSQYTPINQSNDFISLNRKLLQHEYDEVVETMENLGFYKGWVQALESSEHYMPDFNSIKPF